MTWNTFSSRDYGGADAHKCIVPAVSGIEVISDLCFEWFKWLRIKNYEWLHPIASLKRFNTALFKWNVCFSLSVWYNKSTHTVNTTLYKSNVRGVFSCGGAVWPYSGLAGLLICIHGVVAVAVRQTSSTIGIGSDADAWLAKLEKIRDPKAWAREEEAMTGAVLSYGQSIWIPFGSFPFTSCLPSVRPKLMSADDDVPASRFKTQVDS